jgi:hypothetical protein
LAFANTSKQRRISHLRIRGAQPLVFANTAGPIAHRASFAKRLFPRPFR